MAYKMKHTSSPVQKKGPCWKGYEMVGMKKKGGKTVPNCVPNSPAKMNGRRKTIKEFEQSYRDKGKVKSGEYAKEKGEFYYDRKNKEVSLLPTDDADRPITKGVKKRNLGENFKSPLNRNEKKQKAAEEGFNKLENHMYDALDKSASYTHNSTRRGNANSQSTRYVAKKAGAEALGGDLKPQAFYQKSKTAKDEKSGKDIIISKTSGKGYMQKSKVVDGKVEYKHKEIGKGRAKRISKKIDKDIIKKNRSSPAKMRKTTKGKGRTFRSTEEGAGMTSKGVKDYKKENPGSKLKTAVTGKVKPGSKAAKRRKSFCARSKGWTGERGKAARARWKC